MVASFLCILLVALATTTSGDAEATSNNKDEASFVAVVPTSGIENMAYFEEEHLPTTTTTTTPSPFGAIQVADITWVLQGTRAALPCDLRPDNPKEQLATVLWYRGSQGEPIFTYDARDGGSPTNATSWSEIPPRGFGKRARFDPHRTPSVLYIDGVEPHEGGIFRCRVDFKTAQTRNHLLNLTVIVPPTAPVILDAAGTRVGSLIGPYDEGASLAITCISSGGYPLPKLVWYADEEEETAVDATYETTSTGDATQNTLQVQALTRGYFGRTFTCLASNNNATDPVAANVTIDMRLLPRTVSILVPQEPFSISRTAVLECHSLGSRPPATITWWKRGKFMGKATEEFARDGSETVSVSRMTFRPKPSDHQKQVTCRAENTNIRGSAIEDILTITVHYPPKVKLSLGSSIDPENIAEGNDVYMDCEIRANPPAYKVEWNHNGLRVESNPQLGVRILAGGNNLVLQGIGRQHSGSYTCTAFNLEGEETSNVVPITVMYKPECIHEQPLTLGVVPKRDAEVLCRVRSLPLATKFRWTFNNSYEANEVPDEKFSSNGSFSRLNYRAESEKDFGIVRCWAENRLGMSSKPCIFTLIPAGPPDPPRDCDVHNHTTKGLSVTCSQGFGGGLEQTFHMEARDRHTGHLLQNLTNSKPVFTINEFKTNRGVSLKLYASNSHGRSMGQIHLETTPSKVAELQVETSAHEPISSPHLIIGIMVGLVSTLIILAFLIVGLIKIHSRRRGSRSGRGPDTTGQPQQPLNNAKSNQQLSGRHQQNTYLTSPGSDDPDLIPLQSSTRMSPNAPRREYTQHFHCQTGLEDRPPPPSLYNQRGDPGGGADTRKRPMAATLRMNNPTCTSAHANQAPSWSSSMSSSGYHHNQQQLQQPFDHELSSVALEGPSQAYTMAMGPTNQGSSRYNSSGPVGTSVSVVSAAGSTTTGGVWPSRLGSEGRQPLTTF